MDNKEGGSVNRPPILDGTNYDYWKVRMTAFLKSIDNKTWKAIVKGWNHPIKGQAEGSTSNAEEKPEEEWTKDEDEASLGNSKALNVIFNGVDKNMFRLINTCTVAKDAWEILKTAHEGTTRVRMSRLHMLTTQFENLMMTGDETIFEFHMRVRDLSNASFALGEPMSDEKLVRKILRSVTSKFAMKVTAIEEAQDISGMKVDELIGSMQTYELKLGDKPEKRSKSIAFVSNTDDGDDADCEGENLSEALALLAKKFNRALRKIDRRNRPNKQKKSMVVTWPDEDNEDEEELSANRVNAFSGTVDGSESSDEEMTDEELEETYRLLHTKWEEACKLLEEQEDNIEQLKSENEKLRGIIDKLQVDLDEWNTKLKDVDTAEKGKLMMINAELQEKVVTLTNKLEATHKFVRMLNSGSDMLDEILKETSKQGRSMKGIGFNYNTANKENPKLPKKFVGAKMKSEFNNPINYQMSNPMSQHVPQHGGSCLKNAKSNP
ncbi:uncharacterized protein LOC130725194 [Lotus japonicus]|uniref:uncharacterized protein LOC130725194 n=1 Tax=Lotus japonicus TaxID=34305 RepID=UPI00258313F4|nr:uncharacterized protein LOC130725194 [Lotus japonicus]